jgi:hypothetical protein
LRFVDTENEDHKGVKYGGRALAQRGSLAQLIAKSGMREAPEEETKEGAEEEKKDTSKEEKTADQKEEKKRGE